MQKILKKNQTILVIRKAAQELKHKRGG
uniref:Uncharacterized protein n=1 Tax=Rhizophora mucronata TaxID=61149 RepID=A0A2P2R0Q0_RHIMU